MIDEHEVKLRLDAALGERKEQVYLEHIQPFLREKEAILFDLLTKCDVKDVATLQSIKYQLTAIESLAAYFKSYIDTGKMAKHELESLS